MDKNLKAAYIVARFPNLNQTFVMNEIFWMRHFAVDVAIFSLFRPASEPVHDRAEMLRPDTYYGSSSPGAIIKAHFYFLRRSPHRYVRALVKTLQYTVREPSYFLQALAIFPRTFLFAKQAEDLGIDHIHIHFLELASIVGAIISELLDISITIHPHAVGLFSRNRHSIRQQLVDASHIVTISNYNWDYIAELCPRLDGKDIEVVYCGIETDRFQPASRPAKNTPVRILSVGRLVEKKGHENLVDACALLAKRGVPFQCQIVGVGPRQEALQARIERLGLGEHVSLLGALNQTEVVALCQSSDIYALACVTANDGDKDGIPVSLMEAMACELAVVTTPIAGIPELVRDGETGLFAVERDPVSLADALEELIGNEMLRTQLGKQARQWVEEHFDVRRNAARLADVFRKVAAERRGRTAIIPVPASGGGTDPLRI